ncbi:phosphoglycerate dehydrogenase [Allomyces macrogynus ATCC 38327]|uniref:Phosphoglycerate dehydrogenase n=1 Tax=Allomyces macrogynus (strain ATCC 38327) TaxID=578462 RepID=A0A0L0SXF3_ALLM3|nr:phosphoglycerate dehydrogenase [Allomyces macrogynus ATCC 38327]|eukprot:KNE67187.1 phosphoglycerate dehydrogenase [Allomyces macrogynus ATCC 38327]
MSKQQQPQPQQQQTTRPATAPITVTALADADVAAQAAAAILERRASGCAGDARASGTSTPTDETRRQLTIAPAAAAAALLNGTITAAQNSKRMLHRFDQSEVKVLLLENVSPVAVQTLEAAGFQVETLKGALSEDELIARIGDVQVLGIRSKTHVTAKVLEAARRLLVIGCFCIGTNQVDLHAASLRGVACFNSPYANSRSVAEMTIGNIVALARQLPDRNREMHQGIWNKVSANCYEIRGKTLGIVGYGHIGAQLSVLAEAMGMRVVFHDLQQIMALGSARQLRSLTDLLTAADFVTLHVPETPETKNMIGAKELALMKPGSYLINASRGTVVDVDALAASLKSGHLAGAAVDVFPSEPAKNGPNFQSPLLGCPNTLLSPHIGGSTEEAQRAIGLEVSRAMVTYVTEGTSQGAVNVPGITLRSLSAANPLTVRVTNIHKNVPGVLKKINKLLSHFNIERQTSESLGPVAYLVADVTLEEGKLEEELRIIHQGISTIEENILSRVFY